MQQLIKAVKRCLDFAKKNIRTIVPVAFLAVSFAAIGICMNVSGLTFAYNLQYGDGVLLRVREKEDFIAAKGIIEQASATDEVGDYIYEPVFTRTLAMSSQLSDVTSIAETIVENTDEIVIATVLRVNDEYVTCVSGDTTLTDYINTALHRFDIPGADCKSSFVDTIATEMAYYPASQVSSLDSVVAYIDSLPVQTVAEITSEIRTGYSTTVVKDKAKTVGYNTVQTKGASGITQIIDSIVYLNGAEQSRERLDTSVLSNPVDEVVVVGTAPISAGDSYFTWPLSQSSEWHISSYWGDGRGHKGVDIVAKYGTPICASLSGTVIEAGFDSGYGYHIIIDHGNGVKTLYAHASKLYAKSGDYVAAGETIALVGSTGNSSGNHLHFEVLINNVRVNPAPYIGI